MTQLNLATLAPNVPFLDALATWWLQRGAGNQDELANGLFLLPTRRAARGLSEAFLRAADGAPLLLPRISAIGSMDETPLALTGALDLPEAVTPSRRLAILTRMILAMGGRNGAPVTADRAWLLAADLASLLDEAARAEIDLAETLPNAAGQEFAAHWKVTLDFLQIVTRFWPAWLAEEGLADQVARQIRQVDEQAKIWLETPPDHPVIAAGTTGAIPAVARLLGVVAGLSRGQVVLPGLDLDLDPESWNALDDTHPQASLRRLLAGMGAERGDVAAWQIHPSVAPSARVDMLRLALLPAGSLSQWRHSSALGLTGVTHLNAADQQEEAQAIALALREALHEPDARVALVTPDRGLAQRVTAELLRYGVVADDSAGEKLGDTPPAVFLRLLAEVWVARLRPVSLLALLKHPLCAAGMAPAACRDAARALERRCLRGPMPAPGFEGLRHSAGIDSLFLARLESCMAPLDAIAGNSAPDALLANLLTAGEALATTDTQPGAHLLWQGEDGEALAELCAELLVAFADLPPQAPEVLPSLLEAGLAGASVNTRRALRGRNGVEHPRVFIWGLLEARLQTADMLVLGGLSEGVWPPLAEPGPWMNRAMRALAGLPSPEEAVGLSAHDFVSCACAARRVVLSGPRRRDRAPAVPSRWLVRLEGLLLGSDQAVQPHPATQWATKIDRPAGPARPALPPAPHPDVALRPRRLAVTEIETLLRDPYAIYAKHVLRVRKLPPIEESADAADYGRIVHSGLQRFHEAYGTTWPADAEARLGTCMDMALDAQGMRPALAAWWRPRLRRIASWVAGAEAERRARMRPALIGSECDGAWQISAPAGPFTVIGRADRIERMVDGSIAILDYKTGAPPSQTAVDDGLAPQLPLEAAMAEAGAFGAELQGRAIELTFWQISGGFKPGHVQQLFKGHADRVAGAAANAADKLLALIAQFDRPEQVYLSQPQPGAAPRFSDYSQLARVSEWAAIDEEMI